MSWKLIPGKMLLLVMLLSGCDSSQCMKDYYTTNQNSLILLRNLSDSLAENYDFQKVTIREKGGELELMFHGGSRNNVTMYLDTADLSLLTEHSVEGCSAEALQRFRTMYQNNDLRQILHLFNSIEPNAIKMTHKGVFVSLGQPLKHKNKAELEGGILMTFAAGFTDQDIVEEIGTNVYLYDTLVY